MVQYIDIVREPALAPGRDFATGVNLPIREIVFLTDLVERPSRVADGGRDVARADFLFGQVLFTQVLVHQGGRASARCMASRGARLFSRLPQV